MTMRIWLKASLCPKSLLSGVLYLRRKKWLARRSSCIASALSEISTHYGCDTADIRAGASWYYSKMASQGNFKTGENFRSEIAEFAR